RAPLPKIPPHCACGGLARPGVVWFGEPLPDGMMQEAEHAAGAAEVFLVIGTSAAVYPAASLDRKSTRLNSSHSQISYAAFCVKKKSLHSDHTPFRRIVELVDRAPAQHQSPGTSHPPVLTRARSSHGFLSPDSEALQHTEPGPG